SIGGLVVGVAHGGGVKSDSGRIYLTAQVENNQFIYDQSFLDAWSNSVNPSSSTTDPVDEDFYGIFNSSYQLSNSPRDGALPPTITVGSGSSADGSLRTPWTVRGSNGNV